MGPSSSLVNFAGLHDFVGAMESLQPGPRRDLYMSRALVWYEELVFCAERYVLEIYQAATDLVVEHTTPSLGVLNCRVISSAVGEMRSARFEAIDCGNLTEPCTSIELETLNFSFKVTSQVKFLKYIVSVFPVNVTDAGMTMIDLPQTALFYLRPETKEFYFDGGVGLENNTSASLCF